MAKSLHVDIVSAEQELYSGTASMVSVSAEEGEIGVTPGHSPLLARLAPGDVRVTRDDGGEEIMYVSGGTLEIQPDVVTILSDTAARAEDLDEAAAQEAKRQAESELAQQRDDYDFARARVELAEAAAKLRTLERLRNRGRR